MINYKHYTYKIVWSEEDGEYVGLCAEFPSVSFLHKKQSEALAGIVDTIFVVVKDMEGAGETVPQPMSEKHYSGLF